MSEPARQPIHRADAGSRPVLCSSSPLQRALAVLLGGRLCDVDPGAARTIRFEQLDEMSKLLPLSLAGNAIASAIVGFVAWGNTDSSVIGAWVVVVTLVNLIVYAYGRRAAHDPAASIGRAVAHAVLRAFVWGIGILLFMPATAATVRPLLGAVVAGVMAGGAFGMSTVPAVALVYVWVIGAFTVAAVLLAAPAFVGAVVAMTVLYVTFLSHHIVQHGRMFVALRKSRAVSEAHREVIGLVLKEFEGQRSDWLWETDADGFFRNVSPRFCEETGLDVATLRTRRLADLLADVEDEESRVALHRLAAGEEIFDLVVRVRGTAGEAVRYWALTARPAFDADGTPAGFRGVAEDVSGKTEAVRRLDFLAHCDVLTGLANRVSFHEAAERVLGGLGPDDELALVFIDLDNFKGVNETLGHRVGDALLRSAAGRIRDCVGEAAVIGRIDGDEFGALIAEPGAGQTAETMARAICRTLQVPVDIAGNSLIGGACVGIAVAPRHGTTAAALLEHADLALHQAKRAGRNEYRMYDEAMGASAERRRGLESELRQAIGRGEISLVFQPIVEAASGRVRSLEVLTRWVSARYGIVPPDEFIPIAEETGLIVPIGAHVIAEAAKAAVAWPEDVNVAVNLSPVQFRNGAALVDTIFEALASTGLSASRFEAEITETTLLEEEYNVDMTLCRIEALGIRVALDDFGKGYSSLSYLKRFPFYKIKIDKAFVDGLGEDPRDAALVRTIIDLAGNLGMTTTAEGVETPEQLAMLQAMNCATIQGYLFSPPVPAARVAGLLEAALLPRSTEVRAPVPLRRAS